jgi:hypothetical protein
MTDASDKEVFIPTNEQIDTLIADVSSIRQAAHEKRLRDIPIATILTMTDVISFLEKLRRK